MCVCTKAHRFFHEPLYCIIHRFLFFLVSFKEPSDLRYIGEGPAVPENTPPSNWRLKIIKVKYHLEVKINLSWTTNEPYVDIPIIIGTVPLALTKDVNQNFHESSKAC